MMVVSAALFGVQPATAGTTPPRFAGKAAPVPSPQGGSVVKTAKAGDATIQRHRRRRKPRPRISGYTNYKYAKVIVQYWGRSGWVNWLQISSNSSGYYGLRVPGGRDYRFFVSVLIPLNFTYPNYTLYCQQTYADFSDWVRAKRGWIYTGLNTNLQPWGQPNCPVGR